MNRRQLEEETLSQKKGSEKSSPALHLFYFISPPRDPVPFLVFQRDVVYLLNHFQFSSVPFHSPPLSLLLSLPPFVYGGGFLFAGGKWGSPQIGPLVLQ